MRGKWIDHIQPKKRYVYALLFSNKRCYIGISENPKRRIKQHGLPSSAWDDNFESVVIDEIDGTTWDANRLEFAWRWAAYLSGWKIYAAPNEYFDNLSEIIWEDVKKVGEQLTWLFTI